MLHLIGKVLLLLIYAISGLGKFIDIRGTYKVVTKANVPFPLIATLAAIIIQLLGVFFLLFSYPSYLSKVFFLPPKYGVIGAILLIIFTIFATYYFHNYLNDASQKWNFYKNIGLIGGLVLLMSDYI